MSDERDARIVELAVQAAGTADGKWADRVTALVPRVAALFREPHDENDPASLLNTARKVAEAHVFTAEYRDHELDDQGRDGNRATHRIFVRIYDEKNQDGDYLDGDGCQTVRTEPMWSASGRAIRRILESMSSGQRAVFYRYTEQISKTQKMGLLAHLEPLGRSNSSRTVRAPQSPPSEAAPVRPAGDVSPPNDASPATIEHPNIHERFEALGGRQKVAFMHACRAMNPTVSAPWNVGSDQLDAVLVLLGRVEKGES